MQSLRLIPRWVRLVQKTRSKNSHAWAPLSFRSSQPHNHAVHFLLVLLGFPISPFLTFVHFLILCSLSSSQNQLYTHHFPPASLIPYCSAKAIFYCPSMNSHRPRSQNTAKERALIPEKDIKRKRPRSHVSLEKSSKNYKPLEK